MSTRRLSALSNLGENIMGNWRITGFTGVIFGLMESGGFRLFGLCMLFYLSVSLCLVSNLADIYFFGEFLALFSMGICLNDYSPILLTFLLHLLWIIILLLMLDGYHIALFFLFSTYLDLILVNVLFTHYFIGILPDEQGKMYYILIFHLSRHSHHDFRVILNLY